MSASLCKERLANCFVGELTARVSTLGITWRAGRRDSVETGIVGVVRVDKIEETTPDSGVYYADMVVILVRNIDDPPADPAKTRAQEQSEALQAVEKAIHQIPNCGEDPEAGVNLHGFSIEDIGEASDEQDIADIISIRAGVSLLEKNFQPEVQTALP